MKVLPSFIYKKIPKEVIPALVLFAAALLGFFFANSTTSHAYRSLLEMPVMFSVGDWSLQKSILHFVNDGLMFIFFLFVGLEIKRELIVGELSSVKKAMLPMIAAAGGMIVPAAIFALFNHDSDAASGWGIPMATDIAFAIGVITILGSRVPTGLKVLLTAIAIADDLGAILVIALFYTNTLDLTSLSLAFVFLGFCIIAGLLNVKRGSIYILLGLPVWYFMLKSGVHATIAGVLLAITIPLAQRHQDRAKLISDIFELKRSPLDSPAVFLEKSLVPWVAFFIMPVFAFCNTGVILQSVDLSTSNVAWGVVLGLFLGKPIGIWLSSFISVKLRLAELPERVNFKSLVGLGFVAGIGFTMALFVNSLAFEGTAFLDQGKVSIMIASWLSAAVGICYLRYLVR